MCGIAGYIGPVRPPDVNLDRCAELMRRRGPNAEGRTVTVAPDGRDVVLLHSRLAILDLDARSDQPFTTDRGVLAFNGELYNYRELRSELEAAGHTITTSGDTEVMARLLSERGPAGLDDGEGMWGLAWYEHATGLLTLARDRFGEKPLFLHRAHDGGVYFGSEAKFIFALLGRTLQVNQRHVRRFLVNGYKSLYKTRETFFDRLEELPPGHLGVCDPKAGVIETPYWRPRFEGEDDSLSLGDVIKATRERLVRSVELRLRADVPIAFCLSGGIDSNALIGIARRDLGYDVHGFTIMNTDTRYEERDMVELAVRELNLTHTEVPLERTDFLTNLAEQIRYHDAPIHTVTYYAQWRLMRVINDAGYRVSVSGTGADELFSGYFDHHNAYLAAMKATEPERYEAALADWMRHVRPIVRNPHLRDPDCFVDRPMSRDHIYLDADWFAGLLTEPFWEPFTEASLTEPLLRNRMANELRAESVPVILHEDDLNAMYYSIENRSPFLDRDLFEWSTRIPTRYLVRNGRAKAVLREAVRGTVPDAILDNPRKVGFNAPLGDLLDLNDDVTRRFLLADSPLFDIVRREPIEELISMQEIPNSRSKFLFNVINVKLFLEEFS